MKAWILRKPQNDKGNILINLLTICNKVLFTLSKENSILKKIETFNRKIAYGVISLFLKNKRFAGKLDPRSIKRVLILRHDVLGDMIVTLPMFALIKQLNPAIEVHVLASKKNADILKYYKNVTRVHIFNGKIFGSLLFLRRLRKFNFDIIFSAFYLRATKLGIIANIIGGERAVKVIPWKGEMKWLFFNHQSKVANDQNTMWEKMVWLVLDTIQNNLDDYKIKPYLAINQKSKEDAMLKLSTMNFMPGEYIAINVSAGQARNSWTLNNYKLFSKSFLQKYPNSKILIISMPKDDVEVKQLVDEFREYNNRINSYPQTNNILEVAAVIGMSHAVLTPDTGMIHIASATGRPVSGLYMDDRFSIKHFPPFQVPNRIVVAASGEEVSTIEPDKVIKEFFGLMEEIK